MKKVRKSIGIGDFISLWNDVYKRDWDAVMPTFWTDIKKVWGDEINRRFTEPKSEGSYGPVNLDGFRLMLQSTRETFLPKGGKYNPIYEKKYPITYVKSGFLERKMHAGSAYMNIKDKNGVGVIVRIPLTKAGNEPREAYQNLEEKRSFIKSSFILTWPKILQKTMESIGK